MFISNKEKKDISEKFDKHKFQIDNLVKHVAEIQIDMSKADVFNIRDVLDSNSKLQKMYWGADKKIKTLEKAVMTLEQAVNALKVSNEIFTKRSKSLTEMFVELNKRIVKVETRKPIGRPKGAVNKITVPAEKVQEMKDAGIWDDAQKRIEFVDQYIKNIREEKEQQRKEKQRGYYLAYKAKQKAKKAAQKETA